MIYLLLAVGIGWLALAGIGAAAMLATVALSAGLDEVPEAMADELPTIIVIASPGLVLMLIALVSLAVAERKRGRGDKVVWIQHHHRRVPISRSSSGSSEARNSSSILATFTSPGHGAARSGAAGRPRTAGVGGLSFWNTLPGIAFIAVLFIIACAISASVAWALLDGMTTSQPRGGYAAAIALLLPVGAGWRLLKTIRPRSGGAVASRDETVNR